MRGGQVAIGGACGNFRGRSEGRSGNGGNVKVSYRSEGTAPKNEPIKMNADPVRGQFDAAVPGNLPVDNGKLANVFVYVKDGLGNYVFDPPTDMAKIDQMSCRTIHMYSASA